MVVCLLVSTEVKEKTVERSTAEFYLVLDYDEDGEMYVVDGYKEYIDAIECVNDSRSGFIRLVEVSE